MNQIALTIEDLNKLMQHQFESVNLKVRCFCICMCNRMRFGNFLLITKTNVTDNFIILKKKIKTKQKKPEIPLTSLSDIFC
jgi:hypothetical protein